MKKSRLVLLGTLLASGSASANTEGNWFVRPYLGLSQMSDIDSDFEAIEGLSGNAKIDLDSGFTGGLGVGYRLSDAFTLEFGWEYRSNDSEVTLDDNEKFDDGNYASNIFYLNGHYLFARNGSWQPYAGAGLTWIEEIDIDLERGGEELSYSGGGEVGYQVFAGINYELTRQWLLQSELRYGSITSIDLDGESGDPGSFDGIDYETTTLQVGLVYAF
jgi:opacity protein-like surface antigen